MTDKYRRALAEARAYLLERGTFHNQERALRRYEDLARLIGAKEWAEKRADQFGSGEDIRAIEAELEALIGVPV